MIASTCGHMHFLLFSLLEFAERSCTDNGTWWVKPGNNSSWTNFSMCHRPETDFTLHKVSININNQLFRINAVCTRQLTKHFLVIVCMIPWFPAHVAKPSCYIEVINPKCLIKLILFQNFAALVYQIESSSFFTIISLQV